MTKLEMAHDWFIAAVNNGHEATVERAWNYADRMQAEAEKRKEEKKKELYSILADKTNNCHIQGCITPPRPFFEKK